VPLYLGLDCSTQGLTAIVIEVDRDVRRVVFNNSLNFDRDFPEYGTTGGVRRGANDNEVFASPLMWADALDRMMARLARAAEIDVADIRAIAGSAQQHGSVYLNQHAPVAWLSLEPMNALAPQLTHTFSREFSPVWMDATTSAQCGEIEEALGGAAATAALTGSPACERFTGPQIRRFFQDQPGAYADTASIHLVSSFLASLLAGAHAPIDPGDASGTNLMNLRDNTWSQAALDATAPSLGTRLPVIRDSWDIIGRLSPYWQKRYSLSATPIVAWTGDNPSSLVGTGILREGVLAVSLGTSDTAFTCTATPAAHSSHVFRAPTGDFMNLVCFRNGSLAREWVRQEYRLDWNAVGVMLDSAPGNGGRVMLPWLETEITPRVTRAGLRRFGFDHLDAGANVRGLIEGQMMAIANHAASLSVAKIDRVIATGGAAVNRAILQVMANVFDADVYRLDVENSAALGAALRAYHADRLASAEPVSWNTVVSGFTEPHPGHRVSPNPKHVAVYAALRKEYAMLEQLHQHRDPVC
jgi:xylulokinase